MVRNAVTVCVFEPWVGRRLSALRDCGSLLRAGPDRRRRLWRLEPDAGLAADLGRQSDEDDCDDEGGEHTCRHVHGNVDRQRRTLRIRS